MFAKLGREDAKRGPLQHQEETAMSTAGIGLQNVASSGGKNLLPFQPRPGSAAGGDGTSR